MLDETYDVVIVGAGPAGCVLASRLSERPDKHILLIEAGPDVAAPGQEHPDVLDPFCLAASNNPAFHWPGLVAEVGADLGDGSARVTAPYLQGYGVGGASNINGMGADRGRPADYDEWRSLGATGWSWADVLPYFKKVERDLDAPSDSDAAAPGEPGPMPVRRLPRSRWAPFAAAIGDALQKRGHKFLADYYTDFRDGFGATPTNALIDRRVSAPMAYLTGAVRRRPNLTLLANARVDRISLEGARANGVFVRSNDTTTMVRAREVIVSCGAIQTPTLLMRSGIGPAPHLRKIGIDIVQDLPGVGATLRYHPCIVFPTYLPRRALQASDNAALVQVWLRFSSNHPGCTPNDMHMMPFNKSDWHALGRRVGAVLVSLLNSYSTGRVELSGAAPQLPPKVAFNLLADPRDHERLVSGARFALELLTDPLVAPLRRQVFVPDGQLVAALSRRSAWNSLKARAIALLLDIAPLRRWLLAPSRLDPEALLNDRKALADFVRKCTHPSYHVCGTCPMGRAGDGRSVVDSVGRVHGIAALRVVDASIFPTNPIGFIHFIVIMAAEKIADAIKSEWRAVEGRQL